MPGYNKLSGYKTVSKAKTKVKNKVQETLSKRNADGDTQLENAIEFIDPTSITSWDDVYRSARDKGVTSPETRVEALSAVPVFKLAKYLKTASKGAKLAGGASSVILGAKISDGVSDYENLSTTEGARPLNRFSKLPQKAFGGVADSDESEYSVRAKKTASIFGDDFLSGYNGIEEDEDAETYSAPNNFVSTGGNDDIDNFISARESGGDYSAMANNSSATGKYQFIWSIHGKNIQKITGVKSQNEFKNSPEAQEMYYSYYKEKELLPAVQKYGARMREDLPGITDNQIMAAYHFAGPGNLNKAIKNKSYSQPLDANSTSISSYIAPKKTKMKKNKYANGGLVEGLQGAASLAPTILSIMDSMGQGYNTQPVVSSKQTANYNPLSSSFQYALGGQVPIEAEGEELIETPQGQVGEIKGAKHEQGGVPMEVPGGSKIYSDRLSLDGKTMAQRKENRTKMIGRLEKLISKNPKDALLQRTLARTQANFEIEDNKDMQIQKFVDNIKNPQAKQKFAWGGIPYQDDFVPKQANPYQDWYDEIFPKNNNLPVVGLDSELGLGESITVPNTTSADTPLSWTPLSEQTLSGTTPVEVSSKPRTGNASGLTVGDYVGMSGNIFNAIAPLANTIRNRKGDTPNINAFKNYGQRGLDTNQQAQDYVASMRENVLSKIRTQANAAKVSNRNSASSINTIRALDMATDLGATTGTNQVYDTFSNQMMSLLGQRAGMQNQQDQIVMGGEQARDLADRQDRDAFNSNVARDFATMGTNVQGLGRNLATAQGNKDMLGIMEQLSQYGLGWVRDSSGKLVLQKVK